jgi:serine/threonine protein kinase
VRLVKTLVLTDLGSVHVAQIEIEKRQDALMIQDLASVRSSASYRAPELHDTISWYMQREEDEKKQGVASSRHRSSSCDGSGAARQTMRGLDLRAADMWSMGALLWAMAFGGTLSSKL